MNENKRDNFDLTGLDDETVERLAERYPVTDEETKDRIMKKFLAKAGAGISEDEDFSEPGITVSGTERYRKPAWSRYIGTAAALVLALGGIMGIGFMNHSFSGVTDPRADLPTEQATTVASTEPAETATEPAVTTEALPVIAESDNEKPAVTTVVVTTVTTEETTETTETTSTEETAETTETVPSPSEPETSTATAPEEPPEPEVTPEMLEGTWTSVNSDGNTVDYIIRIHDGEAGGQRTVNSPDNIHGIGNTFSVDINGRELIFHFVTVYDNTTATISWEGDSPRDGFTLTWADGSTEKFTRSADTDQ